MSNALLIVDVQKYFMTDAPSDLPERIVKHHRSLQYDTVAIAVFKNSPSSNFVKSLKWDKCVEDTDAQLPEAFAELVTGDNVFSRATYSAFQTTNLHDWLQKKGVERLVICGVDSDACVLATAFSAFDLGYHVKVDFSLTYSSNDLSSAAKPIIEKNIISRD